MALFEQLAAKMVADLIRDYKLQAFQAAAFPGNAGEESGGFTKLQEQNPRSGRGGLGFFQDTGPRRMAFEAWLARPSNAAKNYSAGDYAANYSFLVRELDGPEAHVLAPLRATTTVEEATDVVMRVFERPDLKTAHLETRINYARKALAAFHATGQDEDELRAQGRPGAQAETPTPVTHTGVVLPPLPKLDPNTLTPLINAALPILLQLLAQRQQGTTGAQPGRGIDLAAILAQFMGGLAPQPVPPLPPPTPKPETVVVETPKAAPKPSVAVGIAGLFGSLAAMATGHLGTPLGMGADPTTAGNLVPLAFGAIAAIGQTGVFGPWGAVAGRIIGAVATAAANKPPAK